MTDVEQRTHGGSLGSALLVRRGVDSCLGHSPAEAESWGQLGQVALQWAHSQGVPIVSHQGAWPRRQAAGWPEMTSRAPFDSGGAGSPPSPGGSTLASQGRRVHSDTEHLQPGRRVGTARLTRWVDSKGQRESPGVQCETAILMHDLNAVRGKVTLLTVFVSVVERARRGNLMHKTTRPPHRGTEMSNVPWTALHLS